MPTIKSLVGIALQQWDSDTSWRAIQQLQMMGSPETLVLACNLAGSKNWRKRALGLYIASQLRQVGYGRVGIAAEYAVSQTQALLLKGLTDSHVEVICAAISGLGHRPVPSALPQIVAYAHHTDVGVRFDVAFALGHYPDEDAVRVLLMLANDEADEVRNWATFSLGSMQTKNSEEILACLWKNLNDSNEEVSGEALLGLASRQDDRLIPILLARLNADCSGYELEAAAIMKSYLLLDTLERIKEESDSADIQDTYWYRCLQKAIEACGHAPPRQ